MRVAVSRQSCEFGYEQSRGLGYHFVVAFRMRVVGPSKNAQNDGVSVDLPEDAVVVDDASTSCTGLIREFV